MLIPLIKMSNRESPFMVWVGNEVVDVSWDASLVSSSVTVLIHRGEFQ